MELRPRWQEQTKQCSPPCNDLSHSGCICAHDRMVWDNENIAPHCKRNNRRPSMPVMLGCPHAGSASGVAQIISQCWSAEYKAAPE